MRAVLYAVALWTIVVAPGAITWLKGQRAVFAAGLLLPAVVWWVSACRLATPESWWARRLYGPQKLARARARYDGAGERESGVVP